MRRTKSHRAFVLLCVTMVAALSATTSPAVAQDDAPDDADEIDLEPVPDDQVVGPFKIDDGSYVGTIAYSFAVTMAQSGLTLRLHRDGSGTANFQVVDEAMTGHWSSADTGGLSFVEQPALARAEAVGSATGTFSGSFPYTFTGVYVSDVEATASAPAVGITASASDSGSVELTFELSESVQVCGQIQANWDESFRSFYAEFGWESNVKTQLVAFPETSDDEIKERITALIETATFAASQIGEPEGAIAFMIDMVVEAESIMSAIDSYPQTCPLDQGFLRIVNQILRDMTNSFLDHWQSQDTGVEMKLLRKLVEVDLRAGVLGSGSVDAKASDFLEEKIIRIVQDRFDELVETDIEHQDLKQALLISEMLGHQPGEVSNADLCFVLGGC